MVRVLIYSALLILGMVLSQVPAVDYLKPQISALTMIFLGYIMIQVGIQPAEPDHRGHRGRTARSRVGDAAQDDLVEPGPAALPVHLGLPAEQRAVLDAGLMSVPRNIPRLP